MNEFSSNLHQQAGFWWNNTPHKGVGVIQQANGLWGAPIYDNHATHSYERATTVVSEEVDNNDNKEAQIQEEEEELEHMFEKPLTPSDVGKLNRLVIPKQHAEKYFPLSHRVDSVEKGLLLNFEDELGKLWRFRYSYWNSSQSYVLTKGWSRFVKEKQLDAGDVVSFERRRDGQQRYIRWRRRVAPPVHDSRLLSMTASSVGVGGGGGGGGGVGVPCSTNASSPWTRVYYSAHPYPSHSHHLHGPLLYQPDCLHAAEPVVQTPVTLGNKKTVRLFGVNLDCELEEPESPGPDTSSSYSNDGRTHCFYSQGNEMNHNHQQDFNISREFQQTRNYSGGSGDMPL